MPNPINKIVTGKVVLHYSRLFSPSKNNKEYNYTTKYGSTIIIDKGDKETLNKIETAISNAVLQGNFSADTNINLPLKDGDVIHPGEIVFENSMYLYASSIIKPTVVNHKLLPILPTDGEFISGTYAKVSMNFEPYNFNGKCGVSAKLINVQILPGNKLSELQSKPEDDFKVEKA